MRDDKDDCAAEHNKAKLPVCFGSQPGAVRRAENDCATCMVEIACLKPSAKAVASMDTNGNTFDRQGVMIGKRLESDPTGRKPGDPGAKLDAGKVRPDLILDGFALALMEVAKVGTYGARKYSENGWQQVPNGVIRYRAAGDRHRLRRRDEHLDPDTGIAHLAHEAWNRLAELELVLRENANG